MTEALPTPPAGALQAVAAVKDLGGFVVLVVLTGWVVWKGVPALVAFLRSQEQAMNAITLALTELRAELRHEAGTTRTHVTDEVTGGARHPLKDAITDATRESILRDAATVERIGEAHEALATLIREEHRETRAAIRDLARTAH